MKRFLCFLIFGFVTCFAIASNWVLTSTSDGGAREYVDLDRVQKSGQSVVYWRKTYGIGKVLEQHWRKSGHPKIADQYKKFSFSLVKQEVNCQRMQYKLLSITDYSKDGNVIESSSPLPEWNEILPESITENTAKIICAY